MSDQFLHSRVVNDAVHKYPVILLGNREFDAAGDSERPVTHLFKCRLPWRKDMTQIKGGFLQLYD